MQVAGVTQYLTKVQGMPKAIESDLDRQIRRFLWDNEGIDVVNRAQMSAPHTRGGKKVLNLEARNKAIHLTWLKAYLNVGGERATWAYFADAIIGTDIPDSQRVNKDPESRAMLSRLVPFGHVFGLLLSSFRSKFTRYSKSLCKKTTKTSYNTRYPLGTKYYKERGISTQSCPASGSAQNSGTP